MRVMDERDILFLLHSGGRDLRTVRLTAASLTDQEVVAKAVERWSRRTHGSASRMYACGSALERPRFLEETTRLWIERPDKTREETDGQFPRYGVSVGATWWMFNEHQGAVTNNGAPNHSAGLGQQFDLMLEPAQLLPDFDFELGSKKQHAGRLVVGVHARRRSAGDQRRFLPPLPVGCEEAEFLVDLEYGTLLRLTALFDGEPGVDLQITEIAYNEPIAPETFVFEPPAGETIEDISQQRGVRNEPIEDVVRRASFPVFAATGLDGSWRMRAMHLPVRRGQPHEHVHLHYHRDDATHSFGINEQPADAPLMFTAASEPEEIERNGEQLHVVQPTDSYPLGSVRLIREGTSIEIRSDNLTVERLLEIVDSLRFVPQDTT
jgi:outer membrane lipoprotein-sorting protein